PKLTHSITREDSAFHEPAGDPVFITPFNEIFYDWPSAKTILCNHPNLNCDRLKTIDLRKSFPHPLPMTRSRRIKAPKHTYATYHCITRTVNAEKLLNDSAKDILRKQIIQLSQFCGVHVITYAIMDNH